MNQLKALLTLVCLAAASPALAQNYMAFGGMYGYGGECPDGVCANPYTQTDSCPSGFTAYQVYGKPPSANGNLADMPVYLCGRIVSPTSTFTLVADFGGMWSFGFANPLAGLAAATDSTGRCPAGYTETKVMGTYNMDYALFYCHRAAAANPQFRLGGMYGYYFNGTADTYYPNALFPNSVAQKDACPTSFTASQAMGVVSWVDNNFHFCYSQLY